MGGRGQEHSVKKRLFFPYFFEQDIEKKRPVLIIIHTSFHNNFFYKNEGARRGISGVLNMFPWLINEHRLHDAKNTNVEEKIPLSRLWHY
jgi:hypothetical protein